MKSLRTRITLLSTAALVVVLALAAVLIVTLVERQLRNDLADQNDETLSSIATQIETGQNPQELRLPLGSDGTEFTILTEEGEYLNSTVVGITFIAEEIIDDSFEGELIGELPPDFVPDSDFAPVPDNALNDDLLNEYFDDFSRWDVTERAATGPDGADYIVLAHSPTRVIDRSVDQVRSVLWFVIPALAAIFALLVWYTTGRTLRPVDDIRSKAEKIRTETLHERIVEPGTNDEIDRLAVTLNSMLDRLDQGARQQQQFISDASHELQSPLTVMIGEAQLAASKPDTDRLQAANQLVIEHGQRMTTLIGDLLDLARPGETEPRRSEVDIDDVLQEQAGLQPYDVDTSGVAPIRILGDPNSLSRLFRNLLDNAVRHADRSVIVNCQRNETSSSAVVTIDDDGPGIPQDKRDVVFERFTRLDPSRTRSTGGSGLGLAISKAIVEAHGGTITIGDSPSGGVRVEVHLPTNVA